ncbi:MAG: enoyl-CoA hydratase-related protein, partial [Haliea sp.]
ASEEARFGLPEVKRGLVANAGGLLRLPRQMPTRIATELVLTGDLVSAQRLNSYGLINCLSAPGEALQGAMTLAARIAANGPLAVSTSKLVMQLGSDWDQTEMFEQQNRLTAPVFVSEDAREGALAFAEKREPQWRGK